MAEENNHIGRVAKTMGRKRQPQTYIYVSSINTQGNRQGAYFPARILEYRTNRDPITAEVDRLRRLGHTGITVEEVVR